MSLRRSETVGKGRMTRKVIPLPRTGVVRLALVAEARRRVASGWYDRSEVRASLVEAVLQEFRGH